MTRYAIDPTDGRRLDILLTDVAGGATVLLEALGECQAGRCTCPTDEYQKLASMTVIRGTDRIDVRLEAKPGTTFDPTEIETCLDYTVARADLDHGGA